MPPNHSSLAGAEIRVLHVASGDLWAGAEAQIYALCSTLQKYPGIRPFVLLLNPGELAERLGAAGVVTRVLPERELSVLQLLAGVRQYLGEVQPHLMHTHRQKENVLGSLANRLGPRVPSLRTQHGAPEFNHAPWQLRQNLQLFVDRWVGRHWQQRVVAVTQVLQRQLQQQFPNDRVVCIPNGLDVQEIIRIAGTVGSARDSSAHQIGFVGRLVPVKRVDLFIDAAAWMRDQQETDLHFHIVGDGPLRAPLQARAEALGLSSAMTFHGHRKDVLQCMREFDALVLCSDHEGLPMTLLEACALQIPVIAHRVGGLMEVLDDRSGFLVDRHDAIGYGQALAQLVGDPAAARQRSSIAFQVVQERFSAQENARRFVDLYNQLIEARSR